MPLALYPLQLSPAALGQQYVMAQQPLTPVGGMAPFTWTLTGNLPPGLNLNTAAGGSGKASAVIDGTPRVADQYVYPPENQIPSLVNPSSFLITVADSSSPAQSVTVEYSLPVGVFSERQAISIYEMLDAVYGQDYYIAMGELGTRMLRIGDIGNPGYGGLRLIINALLSAFSQGMIERMLEHIATWDEINENFVDQENGGFSDISGINNIIGKRKAHLLNMVKKLLPAYTLAEIKARQSKGGGNDFTGAVESGAGGGGSLEYVR